MKAQTMAKPDADATIYSIVQKKPLAISWIIWGVAALFYLYEYVLRASTTVMTEQLMFDFGITSTALGVLSSMYYYAYTPLQIPCGMIVDWFGARLVITGSCILCVVGTLMFAESSSLITAQIGRFFIGAGSACAFLSTLKLVAEWFPQRYFAILSALTSKMGIMIGGFIVAKPLAHFVETSGWRTSMFWSAIIGIAVTALCWSIIRNSPKDGGKAIAKAPSMGLMEGLMTLIKNKQVWYVSLYGAFLYIPISAFSELWAVPFLMQKYQIDTATAAGIGVMLVFGMGFGALALAFLSDYMKSRISVMKWSALGATLCFMTIIYMPNLPMWVMYIVMFAAGFCNGAQVLCFAVNQESTSPALSATTIGFTNTIVMMSGVIFQPLLGMILDLAWEGTYVADGIRFYSTYTYQVAMITVPLCLLASFLLVYRMKETYPQK